MDHAPPNAWTTQRPLARWLLIVICTGLASHLFAFFVSDYQPSNDAREYLALGTSLSERGELVLPTGDRAKRMPLWPAVIAMADRWQGRKLLPHAILEIQATLSFLSVIFVALIADKTAGGRAGFIAGIVAALYAPYRSLQATYLCETQAIFLLTGATLAYVLAVDAKKSVSKWLGIAVASAGLGLAVLTRADAIVLTIPFVIDAMLRHGPAKGRLLRAMILILGVALATITWGLRNQHAVGKFTLSTIGGLNFHLGNCEAYGENPGMDKADYGAFDRLRVSEKLSEVEADERLFAMGSAFVREHPGAFVGNVLLKTRVWFQSTVTWCAPTTILLILSTLAVCGPRHWKRFMIGAAVAWGLIWAVVFSETMRPWASPLFVVPLGLVGSVIMRDRPGIRRLLVGLVVAQLAVAIVFIPLERLRWTIDWVFIITLAAATARFCDMALDSQQHIEPSV